MKKVVITSIAILAINFVSLAQKIEFKVNAGVNTTFIPDFENTISVTSGGLVIPGIIHEQNSINPPVGTSFVSTTTPKPGFFLDLCLALKLNKKLRLLLSGGLSYMSFSYEAVVDAVGTPYIVLNEASKEYGNPNMLYLNIKPLNLSYGMLNT